MVCLPGTYIGASCGQYSTTNCRCDVSAFEDQCVDCSKIEVTMCRLSKIDASTFGDCDVLTFEDRCVLPSKIGD